jgi:REP element-mobilizing transposase RayT
MTMDNNLGWYSRGFLPHFDAGDTAQAITFRLADSVPKDLLSRWQQELSITNSQSYKEQLNRRIEWYIDKGKGSACLRDTRKARLVEEALLHFDGSRYSLYAWVIMPNHVHVLIRSASEFNLGSIVHSWKSYTSHQINRISNSQGVVWQREYFDRFIRDETHFRAAVNYIEFNPVKAKLCDSKNKWPFSSAARTQ